VKLASTESNGTVLYDKVLLGKLSLCSSRNPPPFREPEGSLPCSQEPAICPDDVSSLHCPTL